MDPVTHALVGAAVAGSAARNADSHPPDPRSTDPRNTDLHPTDPRRTNVRRAMLVGGVSALLPDLDVLLQKSSDPLFQLELHRQFSHALTMFVLFAAGVAFALSRVSPTRLPFAPTFVASLLGLISAGLLDACTSYGTKLFWPWSSHRFAFNVVPVVDPLFTITLLVLTVTAWRKAEKAWRFAPLGLLALYLCHGSLQHTRAHGALTAELQARNIEPVSIVIKPTLGNQILWRAVYLDGETLQAVAVRTGHRVSLMFGESRPLWRLPEKLKGTRVYSDLERFSRLSEHYLVSHPKDPRVIGDARYAMLATSLTPLWGLQFDTAKPELPARFVTFRDSSREVRDEFWRQLTGR